MSHKTLYIDIDEEITSIVDRVRKAQANEVIVVVPKEALLVQSLVNLKLLKKEANRKKKGLMIVTQDRIGKKLIEKAGILVRGKMDENLSEEKIIEDKMEQKSAVAQGEFIEDDEKEDIIGSSDYFDEPLPAPEKNQSAGENIGKISFEGKKEEAVPKQSRKKPEKTPAVKSEKVKREKIVSMSDIVMNHGPRKEKKKKMSKPDLIAPPKRQPPFHDSRFRLRETERQRTTQAEKYFQSPDLHSPSFARKKEKVLKTTRVKGKAGKYFAIFLAIFSILGIIAGAYFFLSRATIIVHPKIQEKSVSVNVEADDGVSNIEKEADKIPAALEQITKEKSGEFDATGSASGTGKASGRVVIYNEFSSQDQPLVATTRLETNDGKIFRITKNIAVPGMTQVGGEVKPGAIEVDVVADKPGEEYNIEPTTLKIAGFKGGSKYEKFYAKSVKTMESGTKGESTNVTSQDVAQAKENLIAEAKKEALEDLKNNLGPGRRFFEDAAKVDLAGSSSSANVGSKAEKFTYTVNVKAQALSFREDDVKELIRKKENGSIGFSQIDFGKNINYILAESDIEKGILKFEAKTDVEFAENIDMENFKRGVLGKNSNEMEEFIKNYPMIKSADVNFWPFFVTRVPMNEKKVKIEVK